MNFFFFRKKIAFFFIVSVSIALTSLLLCPPLLSPSSYSALFFLCFSFHRYLYRQKIDDYITDAVSACCVATGLQPRAPLSGVQLTEYVSQQHFEAVRKKREDMYIYMFVWCVMCVCVCACVRVCASLCLSVCL